MLILEIFQVGTLNLLGDFQMFYNRLFVLFLDYQNFRENSAKFLSRGNFGIKA